jgi:hypothetical protein
MSKKTQLVGDFAFIAGRNDVLEKVKEIYSKYHAREILAEEAMDELELLFAEVN